MLWTCCHHFSKLFLANKSVLCRHIGWAFPAHWALQEMNVPLVTCWSCCSQWEHMATSLTAEGNMLHGHNRIFKGHCLFACCFFICFVIKQISQNDAFTARSIGQNVKNLIVFSSGYNNLLFRAQNLLCPSRFDALFGVVLCRIRVQSQLQALIWKPSSPNQQI